MARVGVGMCLPDPKLLFGSSDIGNVSIKIPAIHDYLSITDEEIPHIPKNMPKQQQNRLQMRSASRGHRDWQ